MSHMMKMSERVVKAWLREKVMICEQQDGFMPTTSSTDAMFAVRTLMEE